MNQRTSSMQYLPELFAANARWSDDMRAVDPDFFAGLAALQSPSYLWIGCSDSRVPANQITGLKPGEVFVHRIVANLMVHTQMVCACSNAAKRLSTKSSSATAPSTGVSCAICLRFRRFMNNSSKVFPRANSGVGLMFFWRWPT